MLSTVSMDRFRFVINQFRERLWVRPLIFCLLSMMTVFIAKLADQTKLADLVPSITQDSLETLLSLMASSMLVIATLSVTSMISAYASATNTSTPRSLTLVISDDVSQNALSIFIGAFIFSVVSLTAVTNAFYDKASLFILFSLTLLTFGIVIITFVRWVDNIARLGRVGSTIEKIDEATTKALTRRKHAPTLGGCSISSSTNNMEAVYSSDIGYLQHIDMEKIQCWAKSRDIKVQIAALPGCFISPDKVLAYVSKHPKDESIKTYFLKAFQIGADRRFDDDPRFGLVVLSEIAGRALSPAVNDPGTAIKVIGTQVRLIHAWCQTETKKEAPIFDRISVPEISIDDMFEDAFTSIIRDGSKLIEVATRFQKAMRSLSTLNNEDVYNAAKYHAELALSHAKINLEIEDEYLRVKKVTANCFT